MTHGYTYSAHPVAAAAALATLDILERENVVANAARARRALDARLQDLGRRSRLIGDVRGVGLMACIEMVADKATKQPFGRGAKEAREASLARPTGAAR